MFMPYAPSWGLKLVRRVRHLSRGDLAAATHVPVELIADYEEERQPLPGETLLAVIAALRLTSEEREALSRSIPDFEPSEGRRSNPWDLSPQLEALIKQASWAVEERIRRYMVWRLLKGGDPQEVEADIEREKLRALELGNHLFLVKQMTFQDELRKRSRHPSPEEREKGAELWSQIKTHDMTMRRLFIDATPEFRHWALCERIGTESLKLAKRAPKKALELAELAVCLAKRIQGDQAWRRRLRGFALACLGNVHLEQGNRARAEEVLAQAQRLWEAGTARGTEILDEAPLRTLAASLQSAVTETGETSP
jgi:hypothetical protein